MSGFPIRVNDTAPVLTARATYVDPVDKKRKPFPLFGWTVVFTMTGPKTVSRTGECEDGILRFRWGSGDTDTPGEYAGKFVGTGPQGQIQTFPTKGYIKIIVSP